MRSAVFLTLIVGAAAGTGIRWTYNKDFVLDVSGFAGPNPPKPVILWERKYPYPEVNTNENFQRVGQTIQWVNPDGPWLCLQAASLKNGADIQADHCDTGNPRQQWVLQSTSSGFRIQNSDGFGTNKCLNVEKNVAASKQRLQVWDCVDDQKMSFSASQSDFVPDGPPGPKPPTPGTCGACGKSQNHCFSKFGFSESQCRCQNNDNSCGNSWYMWVCQRSNGAQAWIPSDCSKCDGAHNGPCPSDPQPPSPPGPSGGTPCDKAYQNKCYSSKFGCSDSKCRCVNGPGTDATKYKWYQWICGSGSSVAFIDSGCNKCFGLNNKPCPCPNAIESNFTVV